MSGVHPVSPSGLGPPGSDPGICSCWASSVDVMAKSERDELLEKWAVAEAKYRAAADAVLEGRRESFDKATALSVTKARVKADKRMQDYFSRALR